MISAQQTKVRANSMDDANAFFIDCDRINHGGEDRTTVMIRNVPNKYSQRALLELIDLNHAGTYDFFYLPIDFRNKCNLGYAFLNFKSPRSIVRLVHEFSGQRWERFKSDKVCEVTFARIQGKSALVQHFRSSRLMHKHEKYRPLVIGTDGTPDSLRPEEGPFQTGRPPSGYGRGDSGTILLPPSMPESQNAGPTHFQIPMGQQPAPEQYQPTSIGMDLSHEILGIKQGHRGSNSNSSLSTVSRESSASMSAASGMSGMSSLPEDVFHVPIHTPALSERTNNTYRNGLSDTPTPGAGDISPSFNIPSPATARDFHSAPGADREPLRVDYNQDQQFSQEGGVAVMLPRGKIEAELRRAPPSPPAIGSGRLSGPGPGPNTVQLMHSSSNHGLVPLVADGQQSVASLLLDDSVLSGPMASQAFNGVKAQANAGVAGPTQQMNNKWGVSNQHQMSYAGQPQMHHDIGSHFDRAIGEDTGTFAIDKEAILSGMDKRTTVMIRNVPNKYSQRALLELIDVNNSGTYDFFYLPIDFRNKCNLGYAFLNFKNTRSIIRLVEEFSGKRWERFKSDKVCEVTFARIQGKDALVQHFRSSRLMHKHEKFRPLVLWDNDQTTFTHVDDGNDLPFRGPEELPGISSGRYEGYQEELRIPSLPNCNEDTILVPDQHNTKLMSHSNSQNFRNSNPQATFGLGMGFSSSMCAIDNAVGSLGVAGAFSQLNLRPNATAHAMGPTMGQGGPFVPAV